MRLTGFKTPSPGKDLAWPLGRLLFTMGYINRGDIYI